MKRSPFHPISLALAALLLASGCSRELPSQWPTSSPVSTSAEQVEPAVVTLAVDEDPPLPGEADADWYGLERPAGDAQHHHHGHHGSSPEPSAAEPSLEGASHVH